MLDREGRGDASPVTGTGASFGRRLLRAFGNVFGTIILLLFILPFCSFGIFAAYSAAKAFSTGTSEDTLMWSIAALFFGGVGFGYLAVLITRLCRGDPREALQAKHPGLPWMRRQDWVQGSILCSNKGTMIGAWIFAVFWNLVSTPIFVSSTHKFLERGEAAIIVAGLFPLVGLGLLGWAIVATVRWRKFGRSVFNMKTVPGIMGGMLEGQIFTTSHVQSHDGFKVTLQCIRRITSGSGKNRSTHETILWQEEKDQVQPQLHVAPGQLAIPVAFRIPFECEPSDREISDNYVLWRLSAGAEVPGINYQATFEVPVFKAENGPEQQPVERILASIASAPDARPTEPPEYPTVRMSTLLDGHTQVYFPPARNPGAALGWTGFFLIWNGVVYFLLAFHAPVWFSVVFTVFDGLLLCAVIHLWVSSYRMTVSDSTVQLRHAILGIGITHLIERSAIKGVKTKIGMQAGNTPYYDIVMETAGKEYVVGRGIRNKREAEWLVWKIKESVAGKKS